MDPAALVEYIDTVLSKTEVSAMPGTSAAGTPLATIYTLAMRPHLPNEIILMILTHTLAPVKSYFDNETPINEMGFHLLIQSSLILARFLPVSKDFATIPSKHSIRLTP